MATTYADHRFLFQNAISDAAMITVSSQVPGIVSGVQKSGTGSAVLQATGQYSGATDRILLVRIVNTDAGADVGEALYSWRFMDMAAGVWGGQNITTHSAATELQDGINISFVAGTGDSFVLGDYWMLRVSANWGPAKLLDLNRSTYYCSGSLDAPNTITIDYGAVQQIRAIVLFEHNLTDAATVTLKLNSADSWTSPAYSASLSPITDPLVLYLDESYRYQRLEITDAANPAGAIEIGQLYSGDYLQLNGNADWGSSEELAFVQQESTNQAGVVKDAIYTEQNRIVLSYGDISNDEVADLKALFRAVNLPGQRRMKPLFFHLFHDEPETLTLSRILPTLTRTFNDPDGNSLSLVLEEVVKTRVGADS